MENQVFNLLQNAILNKITKFQVLENYRELSSNFTTKEISKYSCVWRTLINLYIYIDSKSNLLEFICNLRQVVLTFNKRIYLPKYFEAIFKNLTIKTDLEYDVYDNFIEINFNENYPQWIKNSSDLKNIYEFKKREDSGNKVIGDSFLFKLTQFENYTSNSQKIISKAMCYQEYGTSILAVMPTGGGKSLPIYLTVLNETKGVTIVVVPIVALAIDQYKSSQKYFKDYDRGVEYYSNDLPESKKKKIYEELASGNLAMIYLSPETILNGKFNHILKKLAKNKMIERIVIDEAHVISDWGEFFRTEFQLLSIFRRKLIQLSQGKIKTVMFSATVSEKTERVLKLLFSEEEKFIQIRGDSLRDEIIYYTVKNKSEFDRIEKIKEIIMYLPRPLIVYIPTKEYGKNLLGELKQMGLRSISLFTSDNNSNEKIAMLKEWNSNNLDIIIATSAFGMGVDKKDVRSVIHTFIPENIDRFYQEVGRVGRDGYNSVSLTLTHTITDENNINYLTRSKVLTAEKIVERWKEIRNCYEERISGNEYWISVEAIPDSLKDSKTGQRNINWNEYVILFLFREKLIDIVDIEQVKDTNFRGIKKILIKMINYDILTDDNKLLKFLKPIRERERAIIDNDIHLVKSMIDNKNKCWGEWFEKVYHYSERKCSGCPVCRDKKKRKVFRENYFEIVEGKSIIRNSIIKNKERRDIVLEVDYINEINEDILIEEKIDCLILNKDSFKNLKEVYSLFSKNKRYIFFYDYKDLFNNEFNINLIMGNVAVLYCNDNRINTKLYKSILKFIEKNRFGTVIHIMTKKVIIEGYGKSLTEMIDCEILNYRR